MADPTVREALEAAFDKADAEANPATPSPSGGAASPASAPSASPAQSAPANPYPSPGGAAPASPPGTKPPASTAPAPKSAVTAPPGAPPTGGPPRTAAVATPAPAAGATKPAQQPGQVPPTGEPQPTLRAPAAWRPEMREEWGKLAPTVQAEIHRRERELTRQLAESAEARRQQETMTKMVEPYRHFMAMEGTDPMKAFGDYLRTAAILRSGSVSEKAQAIANVTRQFGVDIRALDAALAGAPIPPGQHGQQPYQDPRVDQLLQRIEAAQQAQQQQAAAAAQSSVEEFTNDAKYEFIEDVREDMADLLEIAANRGRKMTLVEAYHRACSMHPEVRKVINQRAAAKQAQTPAATGAKLAAAQRAAASVPGGAGGPGTANGTKPMSVREALEAAYSQHTQS